MRLLVVATLILTSVASAGGLGEFTGEAARGRTKKAKQRRDELRAALKSTRQAVANTTLAAGTAQEQAVELRRHFVAWRDAVRESIPVEIARQSDIKEREVKLIQSLDAQLKTGRTFEEAFLKFAHQAQETVQSAQAALQFASYARHTGRTPLTATEDSLYPLVEAAKIEIIAENNVRVRAIRASLELQLKRAKQTMSAAEQIINLYQELSSHLED